MSYQPSDQDLMVVGVGGSAGALEAFGELLKEVPVDAEVAIVIVQHLSAQHPSMLVELLGRVSALPVRWAEEGGRIEARNVYVAPAGHTLSIRNRRFSLGESQHSAGQIDAFFQSLADDRKDCAVGVLLSGNGSDGVAGLKAVKAAGGLSFAQDDSTATFGSMPGSAANAGCVDQVLAPREIGSALVNLARRARALAVSVPSRGEEIGALSDQMAVVFQLLAARTGVDFTHYKQTTILRRISRRMALARTDSIAEYLRLLQQDRDELGALYSGLLINVTGFFRDADSFKFLRDRIFPEIVARHSDGRTIRIWVPGCSTGEECYSLAITVREALESAGRDLPVQIFASDVSHDALEIARTGVYSAADVASVGRDRIARYFTTIPGKAFAVTKQLRDMCVFARQNVVRDSPFSRLDLVSCRNLLIYFAPLLQRKVMPLFHYALAQDGFLFLGNSESVAAHADLFELVDRAHRIYQRKPSNRRPSFDFAAVAPALLSPMQKPSPHTPGPSGDPHDAIREADRIVVNRYGPGGVLVDDRLQILQFRGDISRFLAPLPGRASLSLLGMARDGLGTEIQGTVTEARTKNERVVRSGVMVLEDGVPRQIDLDVSPIQVPGTKERCFLILFIAPVDVTRPLASETTGTAAPVSAEAYQASITQLTRDLQATRAFLQSAIEQHEATNHELRAANEEIQSSNEELQSTNEELETAKEELQSTNEELTTVNEELHTRQLELIQLNNDLQNLINSVHLPIIILDGELRIRRFTPMARKVLNLIPGDVGRPLSDINMNIKVPDLPAQIADVMDSLSTRDVETQDVSGKWYSLRLRPYKTADNKIDGVVLTFIDVDPLKRAMGELEMARDLAEAITESNREPLVVLTDDLTVTLANHAFHQAFGTTRETIVGRPFTEAFRSGSEAADLRQVLEQVLPSRKVLSSFPIVFDVGRGSNRVMFINAEPVQSARR